LQGDRRRRPMGPAPPSPPPTFRLRDMAAPRRDQPSTPAGAVTTGESRPVTAGESPLMVRCVVGAVARARLHRHRCRILPVAVSAATGISRCIRPVPTRPFRRSLSVRRPGLSPRRRSCILLAAASLLRLRTRHTAPCYIPFNGGGRERNRGYVAVAEPSSDTPVGLPSGQRTHQASSLNPHQPHAGEVFLFQPCSAEIDGGGTIFA
jgi:hypothetical protein